MRTEEIHLRSILDSIHQIETYITVGHEVFRNTPHWQDAVVLRLINIGEAVKRLTPETKSRQSQIPWRRIAGMRDILVHDYLSVDFEAVWVITQHELPVLKAAIKELLAWE